jgi:tetratricopeptide (TPR) repeat protein
VTDDRRRRRPQDRPEGAATEDDSGLPFVVDDDDLEELGSDDLRLVDEGPGDSLPYQSPFGSGALPALDDEPGVDPALADLEDSLLGLPIIDSRGAEENDRTSAHEPLHIEDSLGDPAASDGDHTDALDFQPDPSLFEPPDDSADAVAPVVFADPDPPLPELEAPRRSIARVVGPVRSGQRRSDGPAPASPAAGSRPPPTVEPDPPPPAAPGIHEKQTGYMAAIPRALAAPTPEPAPRRNESVFDSSEDGEFYEVPESEPRVRLHQQPDHDALFDEGLSTRVFNQQAPETTDDLPRAKLVIIEGEQKGKTYYLNRNRTFFGRGTDNDVVLLDIAVSRRHARIDRHVEGFRLVDLQSSNGSQVNERRITEAELFDGDMVQLGESPMTFETLGRPRERPKSPRELTDPGARQTPAVRGRWGIRGIPTTWLLLWGGTFLAVLVAVFVTRMVTGSRTDSGEQAATKARTYYDRSSGYMQARDWDRALEDLELAREFAPGLLPYDERAASIRAEKKRAATLARAQRLARAVGPEGIEALVVEIGPDSVYHLDAQRLISRARRLDIEERVREAERLLQRGQGLEAQAVADAVLEREPGQQRARAVLESVKAALEHGGSLSDYFRTRRQLRAADEAAWRDLTDGMRLYRRGRYPDADVAFSRALERRPSDALQRVAETRKRAITDFAEAYDRGQRAIREGQGGEALEALRTARGLDQKLGSFHDRRLRSLMADELSAQARAAIDKEDFRQAATLNRQALDLSPGHPRATELTEKLQAESKALIERAREAAQTDPRTARLLARVALEMNREGDRLYQEAYQLIQRLE